jgi:hypothetical protein
MMLMMIVAAENDHADDRSRGALVTIAPLT